MKINNETGRKFTGFSGLQLWFWLNNVGSRKIVIFNEIWQIKRAFNMYNYLRVLRTITLMTSKYFLYVNSSNLQTKNWTHHLDFRKGGKDIDSELEVNTNILRSKSLRSINFPKMGIDKLFLFKAIHLILLIYSVLQW